MRENKKKSLSMDKYTYLLCLLAFLAGLLAVSLGCSVEEATEGSQFQPIPLETQDLIYPITDYDIEKVA